MGSKTLLLLLLLLQVTGAGDLSPKTPSFLHDGVRGETPNGDGGAAGRGGGGRRLRCARGRCWCWRWRRRVREGTLRRRPMQCSTRFCAADAGCGRKVEEDAARGSRHGQTDRQAGKQGGLPYLARGWMGGRAGE